MKFKAQIDLFAEASIQREGAEGKQTATLRIPLLPEGKFEHPEYGLLNWTPEKFADMQRNFDRGATGFQPMLNFDHAPHNIFASSAPAAGWFKSLETESGVGLFAVVELTDLGVEAIDNKRYRYISAEVMDSYDTPDGDTFANVCCGAALTNTPFHSSMSGLFSQPHGQEKEQIRQFSQTGPATFWAALDQTTGGSMNVIERARKLFGLKDSATEAEVLSAMDQAEPKINPPANPEKKEEPAQFSLPAGKVLLDESEVQQFRQASTDLKALREETAKGKAEAAVEKFTREGKIVPAQREAALKFALENPALFEQVYSTAQPVVQLSGTFPRLQPAGGTGDEAQTFDAYVAQVQQRDDCDYTTAAETAAAERPDLYRATRPGKGA
jgi:phage I-like protein